MQTLEFIRRDEGTYSKDQAKIEVIGVLEGYEELGQTYYHLVVDEISILK